MGLKLKTTKPSSSLTLNISLFMSFMLLSLHSMLSLFMSLFMHASHLSKQGL